MFGSGESGEGKRCACVGLFFFFWDYLSGFDAASWVSSLCFFSLGSLSTHGAGA